MKKLLTLIAMVPAISLSGECFGVDSIEEDRIFYLLTTHGSTSFLSFAYALSYHYANSTKFQFGLSYWKSLNYFCRTYSTEFVTSC